MEKLLRFCIYLIFLLPLLMVPRLLSPFIFPKVIVFRIIVEIMFFIYLLLVLKDKKYLPRFNLIFISLCIFIGVYLLAIITGVSFYQSFWGNLERMEGFFTFLHYWVFFVILISLFKKKEDWLELFKFSIFISLLVALYGLGQEIGLIKFLGQEFERIYGTIGNPTLFAGYLLFHIFLALIFIFSAKGGAAPGGPETSKNWRLFFIFAIGLECLAVFLSGTRGAILALIIGFFLFGLWLIFFKKKISIRKIIKFAFILLLVLIIAGFLLFSFGKSFLLNQETIQTRIWGWEAALKGWRERPLLGWGPENFNLVFNKYFNPLFFETAESENQWDKAHNIILELGSTMGIIGVISYLFVLGSGFYILIKTFRKYPQIKLIAGIVAIILIVHFIHNLFIFDSFSSYILFFAVLGFIYFLTEKEKITPISQYQPREISYSAAIILLIIISLIAYQANIRPVLANQAGAKAVAYSFSKKTHEKSFDYYQKALAYQTFVKFQARKRLASFVLQTSRKSAGLDKNSKKWFDFAVQESRKSIKEDPLNPQHYLYFGALCNRLARLADNSCLKEGEEVLTRALKLSPARQQIYFQLAKAKLIQEKYEKALELLQRAVKLNLEAPESYWHLGLAYLESGDSAEGTTHLKEAIEKRRFYYPPHHFEVLEIINFLEKREEYYKIIDIYEAIVKYAGVETQQAQVYASLAATYAKVNNIEKAIKSARRAVEVDPSFQREAQIFIQSLENK